MQNNQPSLSKLKVEDALAYLDRVKQQFQMQPQVYNDFLDIMKEFKSQTIDTPGVISRVSCLFNGHNHLIVGFNAFLPLGYKIELNTETDTISIYEPSSNKNQAPVGMSLSTYGSMHQMKNKSTAHLHPTPPMPGYHSPTQPSINTFPSSQPSHQPYTQPLQPYNQTQKEHHHHLSPQSEPSSSQPVEFNHAITYVNKIKNRYQSKPEVYKQFLEILHKYQKEQKLNCSQSGSKLMESTVYKNVANLFKDQPDLLQEFSQFLPDAGNGGALPGGAAAFNPANAVGPNEGSLLYGANSLLSEVSVTAGKTDNDTDMHTFSGYTNKESFANSLKNHPDNTSCHLTSTVPSTTQSSGPRKKRLSSNNSLSGPPLRRQKHELSTTRFADMADYAFFDKVRSCIGDRMYSNLLKCLWLYNEMMISSSELMEMIKPFVLMMPDLGKRMRQLLDTKDDTVVVENSGNQLPAGKIDYQSCKRYDSSYLALSNDFNQPKCSGRTALCHEVLNDKYVSFQSWSEDSSSVIRKTVAEEVIFRCEEERYQLDINLENLQSTLNLLRLAHAKMSSMPPHNRSTFKLDSCLGGRSEALPKKTLFGLYGESGSLVMDSLREKPWEAVGVVIRRLESKVHEWMQAKIKNNKTWNEQNQKFYLKSLDHAGINFKQVDAKNMRSKALIQEIENNYEKLREGPHLTYRLSCDSCDVIADTCSLVVHHLRRQANVQFDEKQRMKASLKLFMQSFIGIDIIRAISDDEEDTKQEKEEVQEKTFLINHSNKSTIILTQSWYVFFRLFYLLFERLRNFKHQADKMAAEQASENVDDDANAPAVMLGLRSAAADARQSYSHLLRLVKSLLDGQIDSTAYEESLRELFCTNAYLAFTADKLIQGTVRQLQHINTEEISSLLIDLYKQSLNQDEYLKRAEVVLSGEQAFKMIYNKDRGLMDIYLITPSKSSDEEDDYDHDNHNDNNTNWMKDIDNLASKKHHDDGNGVKKRGARRRKMRMSQKNASCKLYLARNTKKTSGQRRVWSEGEVEDSEAVVEKGRYKMRFLFSNTGSYFYFKGKKKGILEKKNFSFTNIGKK